MFGLKLLACKVIKHSVIFPLAMRILCTSLNILKWNLITCCQITLSAFTFHLVYCISIITPKWISCMRYSLHIWLLRVTAAVHIKRVWANPNTRFSEKEAVSTHISNDLFAGIGYPVCFLLQSHYKAIWEILKDIKSNYIWVI